MGVFGEGGTGKSRLINALRAWFRKNGRKDELIVAATTGSAAVKINGSTVHSAVSIPIQPSDGKRKGKLTTAQQEAWKKHQYMVIDEISMLDCRVMEYLHSQLGTAKSSHEISFGGVNIIFFGDFLQLPAVMYPDLYVDNAKFRVRHYLWRSLNAAVMLREQMRQAEDPLYAGILSRIRLRVPTDDDIEVLRSRIGARLPNMQSVPAVVRRHLLRHAMNIRRLHEAESSSQTGITYCVAKVSEVTGMSMLQAHQIQFGARGSKVDAIIPLIMGVPLLITKNVNKPLDLVNGKIVNFCGFIDSEGNRQTGHVITAPAFMLVKVPGSQVKVAHFPVGVIPLERLDISFKVAKTIIGAKYKQFPVTLAYVITDYKCQGETYSDGLLTDLKTPLTGTTQAASLYVQLSRVRSLQELSIIRDFDPDELREPLSDDLIKELEWEEEMDQMTKEKYGYLLDR